MRIPCPYCGARTLEEFTYRGDATVTRPTASTRRDARPGSTTSTCATTRPAGIASSGITAPVPAWLVVTRDTRTHEIVAVELAAGGRMGATERHANDQPSRLAAGGLIDRPQPLRFSFDGRGSPAIAGDTLASALLANGVRLVGRSFKYHRPRGILTAGSEEPNALVELRTGARREPNTRATTVELYDGLEAAQPEPLAVARASTCSRSTSSSRRSSARASTTRPSCGRPRSGRSSTSRDPPRRRPRPRRRASPTPTTTRRPTPSATCW